ncbi:hypothetical protein JB92DRAFT_2838513 [Gautieria morchelliformis]|nr:hypothetical protein JB92DRAFT_2838513 [Gautieria morchelliformis]
MVMHPPLCYSFIAMLSLALGTPTCSVPAQLNLWTVYDLPITPPMARRASHAAKRIMTGPYGYGGPACQQVSKPQWHAHVGYMQSANPSEHLDTERPLASGFSMKPSDDGGQTVVPKQQGSRGSGVGQRPGPGFMGSGWPLDSSLDLYSKLVIGCCQRQFNREDLDTAAGSSDDQGRELYSSRWQGWKP